MIMGLLQLVFPAVAFTEDRRCTDIRQLRYRMMYTGVHTFFSSLQEAKVLMRSLAEVVVYMHDKGRQAIVQSARQSQHV